MIDAEKLLGGLLGNSGVLGSMGSSGSGLPGTASIGMGLLGVAIAAFEHFAEQDGARPAVSPARPGSSGTSSPPPPPGSATPPPPPMRGPVPVTGAACPPAAPAAHVAGQADPVLLIRAMIASAHADGVLDETERLRILTHLEGVGLTEEEKDFLCAEMNTPRSVAEIVASVPSAAVAAQVFSVSLLAVDVDMQSERDYLETLRQGLQLSPEQASAIARRLGKQI